MDEVNKDDEELRKIFINFNGQQLRELDQASRQFGKSLSDAFAGGIAQGKSFGKVLDDVRQKFIETSLKAALKPVELLLSSSVNSVLQGSVGKAVPFTLGNLGSLFGAGAGAQNSSFLPAQIAANLTVPNAQGDIISGPTFFPSAAGWG